MKTRRSLNAITLKLKAALLTLTAFSLIGLAFDSIRAQDNPVTEEQLRKGLEQAMKLPNLSSRNRIVEELKRLVTERGVDFRLSQSVTEEFRSKGATRDLLNAVRLNYRGALSIVGVVPQRGLVTGGQTVTINGSNFGASPRVLFGDVPASIQTSDSRSIKVLTPAHAPGKVSVSVTTTNGERVTSTDAYTFISSDVEGAVSPGNLVVTPNFGPSGGGNEVMISGTKFGRKTQVTFGGIPATSVRVHEDNNSVKTEPPPHPPGEVDVLVVDPERGDVTLTINKGYKYIPQLVIGEIDPSEGSIGGGTTVEITGQGFSPGINVLIDGTPVRNLIYNSDRSLTVVTPKHPAGSVKIAVVNADGQEIVRQNAFTYASLIESVMITFFTENNSKDTGDSIRIYLYTGNIEIGRLGPFGQNEVWGNHSSQELPPITLTRKVPSANCEAMVIRIQKQPIGEQWDMALEVRGITSEGETVDLLPRTKTYNVGGGQSSDFRVPLCPRL